MSHGTTAGNPALTLVLVLFMLGYVLWTVTGSPPVTDPGCAGACRGLAGGATGPAHAARRLAAGYKVVMAATMGYMLVMMLVTGS